MFHNLSGLGMINSVLQPNRVGYGVQCLAILQGWIGYDFWRSTTLKGWIKNPAPWAKNRKDQPWMEKISN